MKTAHAYLDRFLTTPRGTIGRLQIEYTNFNSPVLFSCYIIERPWKDNALSISSIPLGEYPIQRRTDGRYFEAYKKRWKFKWIPQLEDTAPRTAILIHAASHSEKVQGCLAPAEKFSVDSSGLVSAMGTSRDAFQKLFKALNKYDVRILCIEKNIGEVS